MTKLDVQKRVLHDGESINIDDFSWDEKALAFSSELDGLVLDFTGINGVSFNTEYGCTFKTEFSCTFKTGSRCTFKTGSNCTFNTGSRCTFNTGSRCTFKTGSNCTFKTGSNCTFKTGSNCTFKTWSGCTFNTSSSCTFKTGSGCTFITEEECVIVRRDVFEIIQPEAGVKHQLLGYEKKGFLKEIDEKMYLNGDVSLGEHILVDGILSKVISRKGNVWKVQNEGETTVSFLVEQDGQYSHGASLREAQEDLVFKLLERDVSQYEGLTVDSTVSLNDAIKMYRSITGACSQGTRSFVESINKKEEYTILEIIELTFGQFGNEKFKRFFD